MIIFLIHLFWLKKKREDKIEGSQLIDFNGMSTHLGLFNVMNHIYCKLIFTIFWCCFFLRVFTHSYISSIPNTNNLHTVEGFHEFKSITDNYTIQIICLHTVSLAKWVECLPLSRETRVQSQVESYQRLKKWNLIPPCLTLSIIRYISRVKWSNPGNGVAPFPTPRCSS